MNEPITCFEKTQLHISVRELVEFILRSGDIEESSEIRDSLKSMQEGIKLHRWIQKGMDMITMFPPDYNEGVMSKLGNTPAPAPATAPQEDINYNLNVEVHGLEDVSHEVANTAAKKILDMLPQNNNVNIRYGGV